MYGNNVNLNLSVHASDYVPFEKIMETIAELRGISRKHSISILAKKNFYVCIHGPISVSGSNLLFSPFRLQSIKTYLLYLETDRR